MKGSPVRIMKPATIIGLCLPPLVLMLSTSTVHGDRLDPIADPSPNLRLGHAAPEIAPLDAGFLTQFVRRVMQRRIESKPPYAAGYVPAALNDLRCRAAVTLRRDGKRLGLHESDYLPVLDACRQASEAALVEATQSKPISALDLLDLGIEVELIGPRELVGTGKDTPQQLSLSFEAAVHGIALRYDGKEVLVRPSQMISREALCFSGDSVDHECDQHLAVLQEFLTKLGLRKNPPDRDPEQVKILRFQSTHLWQPDAKSPTLHLMAGMRWVEAEEVTPDALPPLIDDLARFIRYRRNSDGFFAYEFLPGLDIYWPKEQNWVRQTATTWALATYARRTGDKASTEALDESLAAFVRLIKPLEGTDHARYLATPDNGHALGATALLALAMSDGPLRAKYENELMGLLNGLAAMQQEDGSFRTHFPPSALTASQDYYPGEALLALARQYEVSGDARWREVCDRAFPFYTLYFKATQPPMFIPWQSQTWGVMARKTRQRSYADFVFEMNDILVERLIRRSVGPLRIYEGGFDVHGTTRCGISTAVYVEGLAEAVRVADLMGERERAARYRQAITEALRFVVQLRFRAEECYYVRSPQDVIGGVRNTPASPALRIDHCQHALAAMMHATEVLGAGKDASGDRESGRPTP